MMKRFIIFNKYLLVLNLNLICQIVYMLILFVVKIHWVLFLNQNVLYDYNMHVCYFLYKLEQLL